MTTAASTPRYLRRKLRDINRLHGIPNRPDPAEVITHLTHLRTTMSWNQIAESSGCSACNLRHIYSGRVPEINRLTQEKILSVKPTAHPAPGFYIDATPTVRRVQALMAAGHSQAVIAEAAETTQYRISLISRGQPRVRQKIAEKIAAAYEGLANTTGTSAKARYLATRGNWRTPDYWDDMGRIDDPHFDPDAAERPGTRIEQVAEDARWLLATGIDRDVIAERLGVSRFYIDRALRETQTREETAA